MTGFEPATTRPPDAYSTELSYIPFFILRGKGTHLIGNWKLKMKNILLNVFGILL